jgi:hypothetical protein
MNAIVDLPQDHLNKSGKNIPIYKERGYGVITRVTYAMPPVRVKSTTEGTRRNRGVSARI